MVKRIPFKTGFVVLMLLVVALSVSLTQAQDSTSFVVGVINPSDTYTPLVDGVKATLAELGYVEGTNVSYVYEGPAVSPAVTAAGSQIDAFAQHLVDAQVNVIVSITTKVTTAVLKVSGDIPVVFAPVIDPVGAGFVANLDHPGGTATGVTNGGSNVPRLDYFLMLVPSLKQLYVPFDPNDAASKAAMAEITPVLAERNIELVQEPVSDTAAVTAAIAALPSDIDGIYLAPGSLLTSTTPDWLAAATARHLPMTAVRLAAQGVLLTYADDLGITGEQTAGIVDQILRGANPGDIPVARSQFILTINEHTAQTLGIHLTLGAGG